MIDTRAVAAATGWDVRAYPVLASTNDEAARLRDGGAPARTAVVAQAQTAGRGRGGRSFASPPGGLYVSLLVSAAPADLPGPLTAAVAVAVAEALEQASGLSVGLKWPNDVWIRGLKLAGILLESAGAERPVVAGIGINVRSVPMDLPRAVQDATTCLDAETKDRRVPLEDLLTALLHRTDRRVQDLADPALRPALEEAWRARLVLLGERVRYRFGQQDHEGVLRDARLAEGLLVEPPEGGLLWRRPEHVQDLRPASRA